MRNFQYKSKIHSILKISWVLGIEPKAAATTHSELIDERQQLATTLYPTVGMRSIQRYVCLDSSTCIQLACLSGALEVDSKSRNFNITLSHRGIGHQSTRRTQRLFPRARTRAPSNAGANVLKEWCAGATVNILIRSSRPGVIMERVSPDTIDEG